MAQVRRSPRYCESDKGVHMPLANAGKVGTSADEDEPGDRPEAWKAWPFHGMAPEGGEARHANVPRHGFIAKRGVHPAV